MLGPISTHPRAIMGKDNLPYKSAKSSTTDYLTKRYKNTPLILTNLPWVPSSVILEGMFMIQISPLPTMEKMKEYTEMLLNIYVRPHYRAGVLEVHVIFDNPGGLPESPKQLEQGRRDAAQTQELVNHQCLNFASSTNIPQHWRSTIACRKCKRNLTAYLGEEFISLSPNFICITWNKNL